MRDHVHWTHRELFRPCPYRWHLVPPAEWCGRVRRRRLKPLWRRTWNLTGRGRVRLVSANQSLEGVSCASLSVTAALPNRVDGIHRKPSVRFGLTVSYSRSPDSGLAYWTFKTCCSSFGRSRKQLLTLRRLRRWKSSELLVHRLTK